METIDEVHLIKKLAKWERGGLVVPSKKIEENEDDDHSCQKLEVELLVAENKQLRAQVALLAHEKDTALAMWRNERQKNQVGRTYPSPPSLFAASSPVPRRRCPGCWCSSAIEPARRRRWRADRKSRSKAKRG